MTLSGGNVTPHVHTKMSMWLLQRLKKVSFLTHSFLLTI